MDKIITRHPLLKWDNIDKFPSCIKILSGFHDSPVLAHAHEFWELQIIEDGKAIHETVNETIDVSRGSILLVRPGVWHRKFQCRSLVSWACCWHARLFNDFIKLESLDARYAVLFHGITSSQRASIDESLLIRCLALLRDAQSGSASVRIANLLQILELTILPSCNSKISQEAVPQFISSAISAFDCSPEKDWDIKRLAMSSGVSFGYFIKSFRLVSGASPLAYISRRRIDLACKLLSNKELPISAISRQCGFRDAGYFSRFFRRHIGFSPLAWRRRL